MDHAERRNAKTAAVVHNAAKQRFEMDVEGQLSVLGYTFKNHRLFLTLQKFRRLFRTRPGTKRAHAALEYARQNGLTVVAICPFVKECG